MRADAVIIADDDLQTVLDALVDATQFRWQIAGACPMDCMSRGEACDGCGDDQDAAEGYERVADQTRTAMYGHRVAAEPVAIRPVSDRREHTVNVRGELL